MLYALLALCGILSFIATRSSFFPLKLGTAFAWFALLVYWIGANLVPDGSPTDVAVMLVLTFFGLAFLLLGLTTIKKTVDVEEERMGGSVIRRIFKYSSNNNEPSPTAGRESANEYRTRVRQALAEGKKKK